MKKSKKISLGVLFLLLMVIFPNFAHAKSVVFPSLTQAGSASITEKTDGWEFSNNLFSASYLKTEDGKLFFNGSPELSLDAGTEIFQIVLGNGTKVNASQMTWGAIEVEDLVPNTSSPVFSESLSGKALKTTLTYQNLTLNWRAVLRDGSHYLRTELDITTSSNTPMQSITPMMYRVINGDKKAPVIVGNTRGAVIASDYIFAGTETPLAFNMVSGSFNPNFKVNAWTPESWLAVEAVPAKILSLGFSESQVVASQGNVNVSSGGTWTFRFTYSSGAHRMNLTGVDLVKNGTVVASDHHIGYTGNAAANNVYTLTIPEAGDYTLRYWGEIKTESINSSGNITVSKSSGSTYNPANWVPADWKTPSSVPTGITDLGFTADQVVSKEGTVNISAAGNVGVTFQYSGGTHRMNLTGVDIMKDGTVVASDYHIGFTGGASDKNTYILNVPTAGSYTIRYFAEIKTETITSNGSVTFSGATVTATNPPATITEIPFTGNDPITTISGKWSRNTTLKTTDKFSVSTVVGMIAEGQSRRSFLSYLERERAVPWRSFSQYNSWYELNINRNNDPNPLNRMVESQTLPVVNAWKNNLFDKYNVGINAFVWDDGWDDFNSLWDFHIGFPNGFSKVDEIAAQQGAGTGAWLGPVGGYGSSKSQRLAYWNSTHDPDISNFQLSNKEYFDAFLGRCSQMVDDYDMRYFKFDGISAQYEAFGPSSEEDAEGIINVINTLREKRADLFINTTVGTWASPFWLNYSDCVWRQRDDFDRVGNQGNAREQWITYRDHLVYKNFVESSPLYPINSLMTHGLIVTKHGPPAVMPRDNTEATKKGIIREMRCAFASGTNMVELYLDNDLMTNIGNGELWKELAESILWHRKNEDVLADVHWVGGNPWDGAKASVYGWASWNPKKSTFALRNPNAISQVFKTTLRQAMDIPSYITGKIKLTDAFSNQTQFTNITGAEIDIDTELSFRLPPFDVIVFDGTTVDGLSSVETPLSVEEKLGTVFGENHKIIFKDVVEGADIQVMNVKGALIASKVNKNADFEVRVPQAGVYVVKISTKNDKMQTEKLVCW